MNNYNIIDFYIFYYLLKNHLFNTYTVYIPEVRFFSNFKMARITIFVSPRWRRLHNAFYLVLLDAYITKINLE